MNRYFLRVVANELTKFSAKQTDRSDWVTVSLTIDFVLASAGFGADPTGATKFWNSCVSSFSSFSIKVDVFPTNVSEAVWDVVQLPSRSMGVLPLASLWVPALSHCITLPTAIGDSLFFPLLVPTMGKVFSKQKRRSHWTSLKFSRDTGKILIIKYIRHARSQLFSNNFFIFLKASLPCSFALL